MQKKYILQFVRPRGKDYAAENTIVYIGEIQVYL